MQDLSLAAVSRETAERLDIYERLLVKWNPAINLVSRSTLGQLRDRHFADSAQLLRFAPATARRWVDLGSGGGFPGLIVAILAAETMPELEVTLVESDVRKAAFLGAVSRETGVKTKVLAERIEAVPPQGADVLSARALAALPMLLGYAERHLAAEGVALLPKGANHVAEIEEALATWRFEMRKHPSITDPEAAILEIRGLSRV